MSKLNTKTLCVLAVSSALYVVLGAFFKINLIAHVWLDLGYTIFAVVLCKYGMLGTFTGAVGCVVESLLFSGFGISYTWLLANIFIGISCGLCYKKTDNFWIRFAFTILFVGIGMIGIKTPLECWLYQLPWATKIISGLGAFIADSITMTIGLIVANRIK